MYHGTPTGLGAAYQRAYDSAAMHYRRALAACHPPRLSCRILPEYARLAKDLERIFNKDQKARLKYLKEYQIEWDPAK